MEGFYSANGCGISVRRIVLSNSNRERPAQIETLALDPVAIHALYQANIAAFVGIARTFKN